MTQAEIKALVSSTAARYGIPDGIAQSLVRAESSYNPNARSPVGAIGLTQLMPGTARDLGVDPYDPAQNIDGGMRYLSQQYARFGDWALALAAYNAGPARVARTGGVPAIPETQNYVAKILAWAGVGGAEAPGVVPTDPTRGRTSRRRAR
jgi:soluble lytic murein transglycosylase-like protein